MTRDRRKTHKPKADTAGPSASGSSAMPLGSQQNEPNLSKTQRRKQQRREKLKNLPPGSKSNNPLRHVQAHAQAHHISVNTLKGKIRSLRRNLKRPGLAADQRQMDERQLAALQTELARVKVQRKQRLNVSKYHMVRFFERQKATRALKRLRKSLGQAERAAARIKGAEAIDEDAEAAAAAGDSNAQDLTFFNELRERIRIAEIDLAYTTHAPLADVYVSLFPAGSNACGERSVEETRAAKPPLWSLVEKAVADRSLETVRAGTHPDLEALGLGARAAMQRANVQELQERIGALGVVSPQPSAGGKVHDRKEEEDEVMLDNDGRDENEEEEGAFGDGGFFERL